MTGIELEQSGLERRYRTLLRLLPADYRGRWEEDMVATFLATMSFDDPDDPDDPDDAAYAAEYGRPSWPEVLSVLMLAVRLRFGGVEAPPRSYAWGQAVRLVGLMGLLYFATLGAVDFGILSWLLKTLHWLPADGSGYPPRLPWAWRATTMAVQLAEIAAFGLLLWGRRRDAKVLAAAAVLVLVGYRVIVEPQLTTPYDWVYFAFRGLLVLALLAYHHEAPPVRPRPWLIAFGLGLVTVPWVFLVEFRWWADLGYLWDWPAFWTGGVAVAAIGYFAGRLAGRADPGPVWPLALSLAVGATLLARLATLVLYEGRVAPDDWHGLLRGARVETVVLVALLVVAVVSASRSMRRLSTVADVVGERR